MNIGEFLTLNRIASDVRELRSGQNLILRHLNLIETLEFSEMTTTAEIKAQTDALITKVTAETDAVAAVTALVNGLKASVADLTQQLKDAIANGADPAALQMIADNLTAATNAVDANVAAEAALANT